MSDFIVDIMVIGYGLIWIDLVEGCILGGLCNCASVVAIHHQLISVLPSRVWVVVQVVLEKHECC